MSEVSRCGVGFPEAVDLRRREPENALSADTPFGNFGRELQPAAALVDGVACSSHAPRRAARSDRAGSRRRRATRDAPRCRSTGGTSGSPMPDSCNNCGELNVPPERMTSRRARTSVIGAVAPALAIAHADGALALEDQARGVHLGADFEVGPLHHGMQERARRAHAAAFQNRALRIVDAELAFAVVVGVARNARSRPRRR